MTDSGSPCKSRFELPTQCKGLKTGNFSTRFHYTYIGIIKQKHVPATILDI